MGKVEDVLKGLSVVFMRDGCMVHASAERGIKPLVDALDSMAYSGCDAYDKIVGKAAAVLYVLMRVKSVHACVMTNKAQEMLTANGIECEAEELTDAITNHSGDGLCPMETAVAGIDDVDTALNAMREKLKQLQSGHKTVK